MSYNKIIKSGCNVELYSYEIYPRNKGRTTGRSNAFKGSDLATCRDNAILYGQSLEFSRRKDNARHASLDFRRLILSNLGPSEIPLLFTLTFRNNITQLSIANSIFRLYIQRMRSFFGKRFRYIGVPEFQKFGRIHYHVLFWGLPEGIQVGERSTRSLANIWGEGFVDVILTDNDDRLSSYLAKYMIKAISDSRLFYHKAYFCSRNVSRPYRDSGLPLWFYEDNFDLNPATLVKTRDFSTAWLGHGKYGLYIV